MNHLCKRSFFLIMAILMVLSLIPANPVHVHAEDATTVETVIKSVTTTNGLSVLTGQKYNSTYKILPVANKALFAVGLTNKDAFYVGGYDGVITVEVEYLLETADTGTYTMKEDFTFAYGANDKNGQPSVKTVAPQYYKASTRADAKIAVYEVSAATLTGSYTYNSSTTQNIAVGIISNAGSGNYVGICSIKITKGHCTHIWESTDCANVAKSCAKCEVTEYRLSGHAYQANPAQAPTCTEKGWFDHYYCSVCGKYFARGAENKPGDEVAESKVFRAALDHNAGAAADCENAQTCTRCSDYVFEEALGHNYEGAEWVEGETTHWKECLNGCDVKGEGASHSYTYDAEGDGVCECGAEDFCEHSYGKYEHNDTHHQRTCENCNFKNTEKHDKNSPYEYDETTHWQICVCGYESEPVSHNEPESWVKVDGEKHGGKCPTCGYEGTQKHDWVAGKTVAPTVDAQGYTEYACSKCEATTKGTFVPALTVVAEVNGTKYASLQKAIDAADGDTIVLLENIELTEGVVVPAGKTITLDLNGMTISYNSTKGSADQLILNKGTLTINDSADGGKITFQATNPNGNAIPGYASNTITNAGVLVINGGTIENTTAGTAAYVVDNNSTSANVSLTVNSGVLVQTQTTYSGAIRVLANSDSNTNTVNINGGEVRGRRAIWIHLPGSNQKKALAELNVTGGTIDSTDASRNLAVYVFSYGDSFSGTKMNFSGGVIDGNIEFKDSIATSENTSPIPVGDALAAFTITNGTFNGEINNATESNADGLNLGKPISGGTFTTDVSDFCAEGFKPVLNADGKYGVVEIRLEGSGTAEEPYLISSVDEFIFFAKQTQNGNTYSGKIIKLANDIDFAGANYLEIAEDGTIVTDYRIPKFSGTFDGDGHTIKNFNFEVKASGKYSIMMFSQDNMWAYIKNLNIENVSVFVADITGETRISALANRVNAGGMTSAAIENVHIKNFNVTATNTTSSDLRIGGFAYFVQGSQLIIKNSSIEGFVVNAPSAYIVGGAVGVVKSKCDMENVDVEAEFNIDNVDLIGGFAGQTQDNGTGTTFTDCDVEIQMTLGNSASDVGGFIAQTGAASQFYNCTATGSITVTNGTSALSVGGFAGNLGWNGMGAHNTQHEFNNCTADVDITAVNANVGGFIGNSTVAGYPERFIPAYFNNCEAKGDVKTVNGVAGGFVGHGDRGIFNNCSASGNVEGRIAGGFWGEIYPKAKAEFSGGWSYDKKEVTHTDANAKSIVLDSVDATGTVEGTEYEAGIIGFMKDIYVNADETLGYVTPVVLNETPAEYNRYEYPVAKIGDTYYKTLLAALTAAQPGETIALLDNVTLTEKLTISKAITIDGNGHSIIANHTAFIVEISADCTFKDITLDTNNKAKGVKIASGNVVFDNVAIPNSNKGDAITVAGTLTLKNYFKVASSYTMIDARSGVVNAEPGTVFDMTSWRANVSPATSDLTGAVKANDESFFVAYGSTTYYTSLNSVATTITDLTLLADVNMPEKALTVKGDLNLNGHNLVVKELKVSGATTITGGAVTAEKLTLTSTSATLTAPEGLNVTTTLEGYQVVCKDGTYTLVKAAASINGIIYETVEEAFAVAKAGETIVLLADYKANIITVFEGVTLDLNGYTCKSAYVVVFNGGHIVDNSESNAGRLVAGNLMINDKNKQLPVKTETGYMFVEVALAELWSTTNNWYAAQFKIESAAHEQLKASLDAAEVSIFVRVSWTNEKGETRSQDFEYKRDQVNQFLDSYNPATGKYGKQITLVVNGAPEGIELTYQVVVASDTGVEFVSTGVQH